MSRYKQNLSLRGQRSERSCDHWPCSFGENLCLQVRQTYTAHQKAITCLAFRDIHHLTDSQVVTEWRVWLWISIRGIYIEVVNFTRDTFVLSEERKCCFSGPELLEWSLLDCFTPHCLKQVFRLVQTHMLNSFCQDPVSFRSSWSTLWMTRPIGSEWQLR